MDQEHDPRAITVDYDCRTGKQLKGTGKNKEMCINRKGTVNHATRPNPKKKEQNRADFWWKATEEAQAPTPGRCEQKCCGGDAGARDPVQQSSTGSEGEEGEPHPLLASDLTDQVLSSEEEPPIPNDETIR
jgi:hypothetical protein